MTEVDKVSDIVKIVLVLALLSRFSTTSSNDVGKKGSVTNFLKNVSTVHLTTERLSSPG